MTVRLQLGRSLPNTFLAVVMMAMLLTSGCGGGAPYRAATHADLRKKPLVAPAAASTPGPKVIELVVGVQPDYHTYIAAQGQRQAFIGAQTELLRNATKYHGLIDPNKGFAFNKGAYKWTRYYVPFEQYLSNRFDEQLALEQKRRVLDLQHGLALQDELKKAFPDARVILRVEDQAELVARTRNGDGLVRPGQVARTYASLAANDEHNGYWEVNEVIDYFTASLIGVSDLPAAPTIPGALRVNLTNFPLLRPSPHEPGGYGYAACFLVTAGRGGAGEVYSSASLSASSGPNVVKRMSAMTAYTVKNRIKDRPLPAAWTGWWDQRPSDDRKPLTTMSIYRTVERSRNYPMYFCGFRPDPKQPDPKLATRYALSRIAADVRREAAAPAGEAELTAMREWVGQFDDASRLNLPAVAGATPATPKSRESSLASMFAAEMKLRERFADIVREDTEKAISPAVLAMQKQEAGLHDQRAAMQRQQNFVATMGVLSSAAALGGQLSSINAGNMAQAQQFQSLNLQNALQTIQITANLQAGMNALGDRSTESAKALAARIGPIVAEIDGQTYTFATVNIPDLRAQMLAKYKARYASTGR